MANFVFNSFRNGILGAHATRVDLDADTIKAIFIDHTDYTPVVGDDFISDFTGTSVPAAQASCPSLANKTIGSVGVGIFDADNTVFTTLTGDQVESLVLFKATGTDATSDTICRWDTATGLPLTPNGADVTIAWAAGGILTV